MYRAVFLLIALAMTAYTSDTIDNSGLTDPPPGDGSGTNDPPTLVQYARDVQPIFNQSCGGSGCHIGETTNGVNLGSWNLVMSSVGVQYGRGIVEPGNSADSPIIDKISGQPRFGARMPLGKGPLDGTSINIIRDWIDDGAPDN